MRPQAISFSLALLVVVVISAQFGATYADPADKPFDPTPWQQDFAQLLAEMSDHYANLEWAVEGRRMDLPKLRQATEDALKNAQSDAEARAALDKFMNAFGDGHLDIDWPKPEPAAPVDAHADLCERLGYSARGNGAGLVFARLPQFTPVPGDEAGFFPGGLLQVSDQRKIGVIRIGSFGEKGYPQACESVVKILGFAQDMKCDSSCEDKLQMAVANHLTAALVRRADALRKAGATALLVDITGNGGGSNWAEIPPRVLSPLPLQDSKYAFVRTQHWVDDMEERVADVDSDLKHGRGPQDVLTAARTRLLQIIEQSKAKCDTRSVWLDGTFKCSQLVTGQWYTSGLLPYAKPGSFAGLESREDFYQPLVYDYTESTDRLPLYVAVDWNTWSAAEYFAALLQDNRAAVILGTPTGGAGCGYTNGGIPTTLANSKAEVKMPDCVRIRANGSDAVDGVTPDVLLSWAKRDSEYEKAEKLFLVLKTLH